VFFEKRTDNGRLERVRDSSSFEGSVNDVGDKWEESRKTVRVDRRWKRIEIAGFERHGFDCFKKFSLRDWDESTERRTRESRVGRAGLAWHYVELFTKCLYFAGKVVREYSWELVMQVTCWER